MVVTVKKFKTISKEEKLRSDSYIRYFGMMQPYNKNRIYSTFVEIVVTYGAEVWTMTIKMKGSLPETEMM